MSLLYGLRMVPGARDVLPWGEVGYRRDRTEGGRGKRSVWWRNDEELVVYAGQSPGNANGSCHEVTDLVRKRSTTNQVRE